MQTENKQTNKQTKNKQPFVLIHSCKMQKNKTKKQTKKITETETETETRGKKKLKTKHRKQKQKSPELFDLFAPCVVYLRVRVQRPHTSNTHTSNQQRALVPAALGSCFSRAQKTPRGCKM